MQTLIHLENYMPNLLAFYTLKEHNFVNFLPCVSCLNLSFYCIKKPAKSTTISCVPVLNFERKKHLKLPELNTLELDILNPDYLI